MKKITANRGERWSQALIWYDTLHGADEEQLTGGVGSAWQKWYADPGNRRVFDNVSRLLAERQNYRTTRRPTNAELAQDDYDLSIPIAEWLRAGTPQETRPRNSVHGSWRWLVCGSAMAAALVMVILSSIWLESIRGHDGSAIYRTPIGRISEVHLQDGSSITLGGETEVLVAFSAQRRSVRLVEGQAWFRVAHNPHWPFVVAAGDGTITAVGTAFLVTRDSDRVLVTVTEGTVEVSAQALASISPKISPLMADKPVLARIRVSRGEELTFRDNGALSSVDPIDTGAATAWVQGRLTFDNQPLRYVIDTIDRYSSRHIVVSPAAGVLRFSGIVFDTEIGSWLKGLETIFPVVVIQKGAVVRIEMRSLTSEDAKTRSPAR